MLPGLTKMQCKLCGHRQPDYLLDCQCLLCSDCFTKITFESYVSNDEGHDLNGSCTVCGERYEGETIRLTSYDHTEKLMIVVNAYIVDCYTRLRNSLFQEILEKEANKLSEEDIRKAEELKVAEEKESLLRFAFWCVESMKITLTDIDPQIISKDKHKVLMQLFLTQDSGRRNLTDRPELQDTKVRESRPVVSSSDQNPFLKNPVVKKPANAQRTNEHFPLMMKADFEIPKAKEIQEIKPFFSAGANFTDQESFKNENFLIRSNSRRNHIMAKIDHSPTFRKLVIQRPFPVSSIDQISENPPFSGSDLI